MVKNHEYWGAMAPLAHPVPTPMKFTEPYLKAEKTVFFIFCQFSIPYKFFVLSIRSCIPDPACMYK